MGTKTMTWNGDCNVEGCERECVNSSGYCKKHRWLVKHDAKVREPLVDLLKIVRPFIDFRNVNSREIADRIDVALAKVKEDK